MTALDLPPPKAYVSYLPGMRELNHHQRSKMMAQQAINDAKDAELLRKLNRSSIAALSSFSPPRPSLLAAMAITTALRVSGVIWFQVGWSISRGRSIAVLVRWESAASSLRL